MKKSAKQLMKALANPSLHLNKILQGSIGNIVPLWINNNALKVVNILRPDQFCKVF